MKTLIKTSMALVAVAAFALSFATLMALARLAGYGSLAWLYPLTLDLGTVASCAAWMTTQSRQAFHLTWCLLSASILLNGCEHWLMATGQRPAWWLITVISMAPPAILGVVTHLAVGLGRPGQEIREEILAGPPASGRKSEGVSHANNNDYISEEIDPKDEGRPGAEGVGALTDAGSTTDLSSESAQVARLISEGAGRRKIAAELQISEHRAKQLVAAVKNGDGS